MEVSFSLRANMRFGYSVRSCTIEVAICYPMEKNAIYPIFVLKKHHNIYSETVQYYVLEGSIYSYFFLNCLAGLEKSMRLFPVLPNAHFRQQWHFQLRHTRHDDR